MGRIALHCMLSPSRLSLLCFSPFRPFHTAHVLLHIPSFACLERIVQATTSLWHPCLLTFPPQVSQRRSSPKFEPFFPNLVYYTLHLLFPCARFSFLSFLVPHSVGGYLVFSAGWAGYRFSCHVTHSFAGLITSNLA
ncbi:hypothetical protein BJY01DRAFT_158430 [Aspergillus pseudoustus]|uniref:Secreted protein n=1 Tax=Aspergillus pseudoustus TaxID=1810923 RepID=A0ABR4KXU9_9EURO